MSALVDKECHGKVLCYGCMVCSDSCFPGLYFCKTLSMIFTPKEITLDNDPTVCEKYADAGWLGYFYGLNVCVPSPPLN
jgi:hypothetical protein